MVRRLKEGTNIDKKLKSRFLSAKNIWFSLIDDIVLP